MNGTVKIGAIIGVAGLLAVGAAVGPELWAGYRFMNILDRKAAAHEADGGPWPQHQDGCALCHGGQGRAGNAHYPSLAGLPADYIEAQLRAFADGSRHDPQMSPLSRALSDDRIRELAAYYARQTPARNKDLDADPAMVRQGQALVAAQACVACHGERLTGSPQGPLLAGQGKIYLADQLTAYRRGERRDPTQAMNAIASALSEEEIEATASYAASLAPESNSNSYAH